jgi:hypothetical protein
MDQPSAGSVRRGEVLALEQLSLRRREYRLRGAGPDLGRLRFAPGRRSVAQAVTEGTGPLGLAAGPGRVEVRRDGAVVAPAALLLSVVGGFLALREVQAGTDAAAAVGGSVAATGAG